MKPISEVIPKESLLLKHAVSKIRWNVGKKQSDEGHDSDDSDRTVKDERSSKSSSRGSSCESNCSYRAEVVCENGEKFSCNHVICTIPLGEFKFENWVFLHTTANFDVYRFLKLMTTKRTL